MIERIFLLAFFWLMAVFLPRSLWIQPWLLTSVQIIISVVVVVGRAVMGSFGGKHFLGKPSRSLLLHWSSVVVIAGIAMLAQAWRRDVRINFFDPLSIITLGHTLIWLYLSVGNQLKGMAESNKKEVILEVGRKWNQMTIIRLALSELRALRYAVAPPSRMTSEDVDCKRFWPCRDVSQMAWMFVIIAVLESVILHIVAFEIKGFLIVGVAVISDVFIIYTIGIARSISIVPTEIMGDKVFIRVGILFEAVIKKSDIEYGPINDDTARKRAILNGSLLSSPNLFISLKSDKLVSILSVFSRRVVMIKMKIERPDEFIEATRL